MKTLIVFLALTLPMLACAQQGLKPMDEKPAPSYDPKQYADGQPSPQDAIVIPANTQQVIQNTGQRYSSDDLTRMARKDINGVASMTAGVQSIDGGVPHIRGAAASGTAYFVDGVRVYGALPILTK
jgi:hypothetical protein